VELVDGSTLINLSGVVLSVTAAGTYIGSNLYLKGACIFSCLDSVAARITDRQETEFMESPTFIAIESEIGKPRALQFLSIIKQIRSASYGNMDPYTIMGRFLNLVSGKKLSSIEDLNMPNAPTFVTVVHALNKAYEFDSIVYDYLYAIGRKS
jgi:hypothetical protein